MRICQQDGHLMMKSCSRIRIASKNGSCISIGVLCLASASELHRKRRRPSSAGLLPLASFVPPILCTFSTLHIFYTLKQYFQMCIFPPNILTILYIYHMRWQSAQFGRILHPVQSAADLHLQASPQQVPPYIPSAIRWDPSSLLLYEMSPHHTSHLANFSAFDYCASTKTYCTKSMGHWTPACKNSNLSFSTV